MNLVPDQMCANVVTRRKSAILWTIMFMLVAGCARDATTKEQVAATPANQPSIEHATPRPSPVDSTDGDQPAQSSSEKTTGAVGDSVELSTHPITLTLPSGWHLEESEVLTAALGSDAVTHPQAVATTEDGAGELSLTLVQLPTFGLTLANYVDMVAGELAEEPAVELLHADVVSGIVRNGAPVGILEYRITGEQEKSGDRFGYQVTRINPQGTDFLVYSYLATPDLYKKYHEEALDIMGLDATPD